MREGQGGGGALYKKKTGGADASTGGLGARGRGRVTGRTERNG